MEITPLEIALAVAAVFIVFGPKRAAKPKSSQPVVKLSKIDTTHLRPAYHAAGRAPSPLAKSQREFQFATAESKAAPLPHEFYWT